MRSHATISGSELLLSVIAIRMAALVLVGWALALLPRQPSEPVCLPSSAARVEAQQLATTVGAHIADDAALDDMRLHD